MGKYSFRARKTCLRISSRQNILHQVPWSECIDLVLSMSKIIGWDYYLGTASMMSVPRSMCWLL